MNGSNVSLDKQEKESREIKVFLFSLQKLKSIHNIYKHSDDLTRMAVSGNRTVYDGWFCFEHSKIVDGIMAVITMGMQANLTRKLMLCRWTFLSFYIKENHWWDMEFIFLFLCN